MEAGGGREEVIFSYDAESNDVRGDLTKIRFFKTENSCKIYIKENIEEMNGIIRII